MKKSNKNKKSKNKYNKTNDNDKMNNKFEKYNFSSLVPVNNVNNDAFLILDKKLNDDKVKNIAITGPYASGKSSFINSYFNSNDNIKESDYLTISLATFDGNTNIIKDDIDYNKNYNLQNTDNVSDGNNKENNLDNEKNNVNDVSNFLEKIIIEKIYYSNKNNKDLKKFFKIFCELASIFTILFIIFDWFIIKTYRKDLISIHAGRLRYIVYLTLGLIFIFSVLSSIIIELNNKFHFIKKFAYKGLEIEDKNTKYENILNNNLELIIEQFKIKKYKYIIFDDLDRFNNTLIFERLRDLNITLNKCLDYKIVFIYEIRDDLFENQDRTKFFDFILPIIPYVGYDNSVDIIYKTLREHNINESELSPLLINEISTYLLDNRIISNIVNEYIIYKENLKKHNFNFNQLFSMIIYKNVCPKDYAKLQNNEGQIYSLFKKKNNFIKEKKDKLNEKLESLLKEKNENTFKNDYILGIRGLLFYALNNLHNREGKMIISYKNDSFIIENMKDCYKIPENILIAGSSNINIKTSYNRYILKEILENDSGIVFDNFANKINNIDSEIDLKIQDINKQISDIENSTLADLINKDDTILDDLKFDKYTDLIKLLLNEGYINENYVIYMSKYEEGKISPTDIDFIANVRTNHPLTLFENELEAPKEVISRLGKNDFSKTQILNVSIAKIIFSNEFLDENFIENEIKNSKNVEAIKNDREIKKNKFISTLINSQMEIEFIYLCYNKMSKQMYKELINLINYKDNKLCSKVINSYIIEEKNKKILINSIMINIPSESINDIGDVVKYISKNQILLNKNIKLIEKLNIKYTNLINIKENDIQLYNDIIEKRLYELNTTNILTIIGNNNNFYKKNLEIIETDQRLFMYIMDNINEYIKNIYNKLENQNSNNNYLIKILNNKELSKENRKIILEKEQIGFKDILKLNKEIWNELIENSLFDINLKNINNYYLEFGLNSNLTKVINRIKIDIKNNNLKEELDKSLVKKILISDEIDDSIVRYVAVNSKCILNPDDIKMGENTKFIEERVIQLIKSKNIVLYEQMLLKLKEKFSSKVWLKLLETDKGATTRILKERKVKFSNIEINDILLSNQTIIGKFYAICQYNLDEEFEMPEKIKSLAINILLENDNRKKSLEDVRIIKELLSSKQIKDNKKVELFNNYFYLIDKENVKSILGKVSYSYVDIILNGKRPKLLNNIENKKLISNLISLGFNIQINNEEKDNIIIKGNWNKNNNFSK